MRVVSMPCGELFESQPAGYREHVLPSGVGARLAVEAGISLGWERWVGPAGDVISVERFGGSAPGATVLERFGFSPQNVARHPRAQLEEQERVA